MSDDNYVKPPKGSGLRRTLKAMKDAYSYLNPNYMKRKLVHLVFVVPMVFIIYGLIYGFILMDLTGMDNYTMPWILKFLDFVLIMGSTVVSAYFYPFARWWYKQSLLGNVLNNIYHVGSFWIVILKVIATLIGGIIIAGVLAPVIGPIVLWRCKKKNMIIGDASDFQ